MVAASFKESAFDTGFDLNLLFEIANYWEEVRRRGHYKRGVSSLIHMQVYKHQIPGGMMSNLMSSLRSSMRLTVWKMSWPKFRAFAPRSVSRRSLLR